MHFKTINIRTSEKEIVFGEIEKQLTDMGFVIQNKDDARPWGGFFVIDESQSKQFKDLFFPNIDWKAFKGFAKLSPKILLVEPDKRLSWQYHFRRAEIWKLVRGSAGVVRSQTDEQGEPIDLAEGEIIELAQGERHRLIGYEQWGIVAEIWKHTDAENPSDEDDIVRVEDDFGR